MTLQYLNKVAEYYTKYKEDLSMAESYDEQMKTAYEKYKSSFDKFSFP
jgi:hypothetical protein